ncbi:MFS transporter [Mycolicibacterium smegmatis]|uniref:Transporter protein n=1 Tax=Mycolicibacterium smegmatis (strain MKD8) TaxID=1214915 RepID=A0A2U9PKH3_MYCSE|nr:MFS transporter [Mycolicibacterium smegmatis]AWT52188.1 transporter protein [Mycolicibacterium smegmatis MKD8]
MTSSQIHAHNAYRVISRRLLPLFLVGQLLMNIDRSTISYAALQLNESLGVTAEVFGLAAGIFFVGYALFEVPSNLALQRVGATKWIGAIVFAWGTITALQAFVPNGEMLVLLRFLMGVVEGGFTPGVIFTITLWLPSAQRGRALALTLLAVPIAGMIGGPLAGLLLGVTWLDLHGWQWLFIAAGVVTMAFALLWFRLVPASPQHARWMSAAERAALTENLELERKAQKLDPHGSLNFVQALKTWPVWVYSLAYFAICAGYFGIFFWLPQIIHKGFEGISSFENGLLAGLPFVIAMVTMTVLGRSQDRTGDRRWHLAMLGVTAGLALGLSMLVSSHIIAFAALCVAVACALTYIVLFWASPMSVLAATAAAGGIALINSIGNLGGFVGPYLAGILAGEAHEFTRATSFFAGMLLLAGAVPITFKSLFPSLAHIAARTELAREADGDNLAHPVSEETR